MTAKNDVVLPLGNKAFWDQKRSADEGTKLKGVSESCVLLLSLKQSRERWLFKTFPKFSSRSRNNKDPAPPPHTIQTRGTCNVAIGPHIFPETIFYEVHYLPPQGYQPSSFSNQPQATNAHWQSTSSYTSYAPSHSQNATTSNGAQTSNSTFLADKPDNKNSLDSLPASIALTPQLIQQVNSAASSNPILANLLQLAAAGKATQDQLKTLGLLIQSFASLSSGQGPTTSPYSPYSGFSTYPPVKEFDLVFEFREAPNDRWYIPRVPVYVERKPSPDAPNELDVTLLTCVPFDIDKQPPTAGREAEISLQYPIMFTLKNAPYTVWETVWRWVGGESKNTTNKDHIEKQVSPPRLYLGHQLAPGPQLTQLQAASAPLYTMRTLKQGPSSHNRSGRQKRRKETDGGSGEKSNNATGDTIAVKRARSIQSKATPLAPIQCTSCKNTDVPLILGGKYCRPCAEVEKQKASMAADVAAAPVPVQTTITKE